MTKTITTTEIAPANFNRASAGYSDATILAMVASVLGAGFYTYPGGASHLMVLGHKDNRDRAAHSRALESARGVLRSYGVQVRRAKEGGRVTHLTVIGPRRGGRPGSYSA